MLFDLKGRRKRFIQVVYLILAILFGGGLVFFGVGSDVQGGLFDAISGSGGANADSSEFEKQAERAERAIRADPKNERALLALARAEYNTATSGGDFNRDVGQFEEGATDELKRAVRAWERYLALDPKRPDPGAAALMMQAYATLVAYGIGGSSLDLFERAAQTQGVIATRRPSPSAYYQLASIWYAIGDIRKGDRAADKAIELTPKDQRNTVTAQLDDARKDGVKQKGQLKKAEALATKRAREARKAGQDPFGAPPVQSPLGSAP